MWSYIKSKLGLSKDDGTIPLSQILPYVPDSPVVIEAGAFNGMDTLKLSKQFNKGHIHAFEPVPEVYQQLVERAGQLPNVTTHPVALGAAPGTLTMYLSGATAEQRSSSSLLPPKDHLKIHDHIAFDERIEVPVITLDGWAAEADVERVDFMWLDMQGNELAVLKASPRIMATVQAIYTEVSLVETYEGVPLYGELREWMESQGFTVAIEKLPWKDMGNVLFVRG